MVVVGRLDMGPGRRVEHMCAQFIKRKQAMFPNHDKPHQARQEGRGMYADVCSPISTASVGGSLYDVSCVREYYGYATFYTVLKKSYSLTKSNSFCPRPILNLCSQNTSYTVTKVLNTVCGHEVLSGR